MSHGGFATTGYEKSRCLRLWDWPPVMVKGEFIEVMDSIGS
jgi:hypothetical protein